MRTEIEAKFGAGNKAASGEEEYAYPDQGVVLRYENDFLHTYVFSGADDRSSGAKAYRGKPAPGLEWGASEAEIVAALGPTNDRQNLMKPYALMYGRYIFQLGAKGELVEVAKVDMEGLQARRNQDPAYLAASAAAVAQQMKDGRQLASDQVALELQGVREHVADIVNVANNIVRDLNSNSVYQLGVNLGERTMKENEVRRLQAEAIALIDGFLKKHQGRLPQEAIDALDSDRARVSDGGIRQQ